MRARRSRPIRRRVCIAVSALVAAALAATGALVASQVPIAHAQGELALLPRPHSWEAGTGEFNLATATSITLAQGQREVVAADGAGQPLVKQRLEEVAETLAHLLDVDFETTASISEAAAPAQGGIHLKLAKDDSLGTEGYRLTTAADGVQIEAPTAAGAYYAVQSLIQLAQAGKGKVPAGTIEDAPDIEHRFQFIDAGRKYFALSYLKDVVRQMAAVKMNTLHLHIAESEGFRLRSAKYPGLADEATSYSEEEIKDLVEFARRHQVDVVPGFEFPGHATIVSDYFKIGMGDGPRACGQQYTHSHVTPNWTIDLTSDAARDKVKEILGEFLPWFTSPYVHLGGDELPGQAGNCPRVQDFMTARTGIETFGDVQIDFLNDINGYVEGQQRTLMIYNGFENTNPTKQTLDPSVAIMDWEGEGTKQTFAGHEIHSTNSDYAYLTPNNYHNKIPNLSTIASSWGIRPHDRAGAGLSVWADYNLWAQDEYFELQTTLPRRVMADRIWNTTAADVEEVKALANAMAPPAELTGFEPLQRVGASQPRHHYTFEDTAYPPGYHWAGSSGNSIRLEDTTGRLNGSSYIIWNPAVVPDGVVGKAWNFTGDNQGVGLGGVDIPPPWTMSVWVKPSEWLSSAPLISSNQARIELLDGKVRLTGPAGPKEVAASFPKDAWSQLTVVAGETSTAIFRNGKEVGSVDAAIPLPLKAIGTARGATMYRGQLDEMYLYDAAISDEQVSNLYFDTKPKAALIHHWKLNEGSGARALDSVTGNVATIDGAEWITDSPRGPGLRFDGEDDGLDIGLKTLSSPWAAAMWVRSDSAKAYAALFGNNDDKNGTKSALRLHADPPGLNLGYTRVAINDYSFGHGVEVGEWAHVIMVGDGAKLTLYLDGEQIGTIDVGTATLGLDQFGRLVEAGGKIVDGAAMAATDLRVYQGTVEERDAAEIFAEANSTPGLELAITGSVANTDGDRVVGLGDDASFTVNVRNSGNAQLSDLKLELEGPVKQALKCKADALAKDATTTCTGRYLVPVPDMMAALTRPVVAATAQDQYGTTATVSATGDITIKRTYSLLLKPAKARPGQNVTITMDGYVPGENVEVAIAQGGTEHLRMTAGPAPGGDAKLTWRVPSSAATGTYLVSVNSPKHKAVSNLVVAGKPLPPSGKDDSTRKPGTGEANEKASGDRSGNGGVLPLTGAQVTLLGLIAAALTCLGLAFLGIRRMRRTE